LGHCPDGSGATIGGPLQTLGKPDQERIAQCAELYSGLWPDVGHIEDVGAAVTPRQGAPRDGRKERRRTDDQDVWLAQAAPYLIGRETAKGELGENALEEALVWTDIAPYTLDKHAIAYFASALAIAILRRHNPKRIVGQCGQHRDAVPAGGESSRRLTDAHL